MLTGLFFGGVFVAATVGLTFASYFVMRWATGAEPAPHNKDLANSVIFRISALHGLILALVFAQEMAQYQDIRLDGAAEADAIADVYFDAGRYGPEGQADIQSALAKYVELVIGEEWRSLGESGALSSAAWDEWDKAYGRVLDLVPATKRQESLREHMLQQVHVIAESRVKRENEGSDSLNRMFWLAALSGVVLIALAYYPFPPDRQNLILICMYGAFTGIVLFFIYAFSNPYAPPGALSPRPFEQLSDELAEAQSLPAR